MAKRRFWRDIVGVFNSNVFSIISALLISVLLTRILGPEGYGIYTTLLIVPVIVVSLTHLGIRGSAVYHVGHKTYDESELVSSILNLLILSSIAGIILSIVGYFFVDTSHFTIGMIALVLLTIPVRLAIIYIGGIFLGKDEIQKANMMNWTANFLNLVFVAIFVWWIKGEVIGAVVAILISNYAISFYGIYLLRKEYHINLKFHPKILKSLLKLGIVFSVSFFIIQLNFRLDILLLQRLSTIAEVGIYSLGVSIAEQLWQLPLAMGIVVFSRTATTGNSMEMTLMTTKLLRISLLATAFVAIGIYFLSPFLVPLIFGDKFIPSIQIIQVILPGILLIVLFRILSGQIAGMGKPQLTIYIFVPALVVNVLLNLLWIPIYGGVGAAYATNVSYAIGALAYTIAYSRILKIPIVEIFRYRKSDFGIVLEMRDIIRNKWRK